MAEEFTAEQVQGGTQVAEAAVTAAGNEKTAAKARPAARRAARQAADQAKLELDDGDVDRIANAVVDMLDQRGAFDPPPESVAPPPAEQPGAQVQPGGEATAPQAPAAPRTFAERFRKHG